MDQKEYEARYRAAQTAIAHDLWKDVRDDGVLWGEITESVMVLADGEEIEYHEARGVVDGGQDFAFFSFTASRRIAVRFTYNGPTSRSPFEASARSRRGLQRVTDENIGGGSKDERPTGLALSLAYEGEPEPTVLGSRAGLGADYSASGRLADFYRSLLRDLDR